MTKKILLVCKETFSWPMHYLAEILREQGHTVAAFFIMPHEVLLNHPDYREFVKLNPNMTIFTTREMALEYFNNVKAGCVPVDWGYMNKIEKEYSYFKPLGLQMLSSQLLSTYYHNRHFYRDLPRENQLYFMQLYYKSVEEMLDDFKPDCIYDSNLAEHGRTVLLEVAYARSIPYVSVDQARFRNYYLPTITLMTAEEPWLVEAFKAKKQEISACVEPSKSSGFQLLEVYRGESNILPTACLSKFHANKFSWKLDIMKMLYWIFRIFQAGLANWSYLRHVTTPLFSDPIHRALFEVQYVARKCAIRYLDIFDKVDLKRESYILFPLHYIPESSTFTLAPFYLNEIFLIESVSKSALPHQKILIKEHHQMIGERPLSFYRKLKRLPNVTFVDPFMFDDPKPYIEHADGVVTITGSSALEAALLGKPSIIFGSPIFSVMSSVQQLSDVTELPRAIRSWPDYIVDDLDLAAYLEVVTECGVEISMPALLLPPLISDPDMVRHQTKLLYDLLQRGERAFHRYYKKP